MAFIDDLKERHAALDARLSAVRADAEAERLALARRHEDEQAELIEALSALEKLLSFEAKTDKVALPETAQVPHKSGRQPLPDYVLRQIRLMGRATKDDLRASASRQGFFEKGDNGGRSIHAVIMNLMRGGKIVEVVADSGIYKLARPVVVSPVRFHGGGEAVAIDHPFSNEYEEGPQADAASKPSVFD